MRIGECPARIKSGHVQPARVTVCILTSIPAQLDYYAHRLDVLKLSLASLRAHTARSAYDLLVFDNGSCREVVDYLVGLRDRGDVDLLMLSSRNRGKIDACRIMFEAAPGAVVAYADDDVWFGPGWLEAQLAILDAFPRVGMVSGRPVRQQFAYGNAYLERYLRDYPEVSTQSGELIPREWEHEHMRSTGRPQSDADAMAAAISDIRLDRHGLQAYSTAAHFQFIAPKAVILAALNTRDQPRTGSEERQFEEAVDAAGFARLSTVGRHVRHIGNAIAPELLAEAGSLADDVHHGAVFHGSAFAPFARLRWVRAAVARLNSWSYALLYQPRR